MPERHTVDFAGCSFNVVTDGDRRTITLQFDHAYPYQRPIGRVLDALRRRYGPGVIARLNRWRSGEGVPFVLPTHSTVHPDCPDVLCFEIGVKGSGRMDAALATLLEFLRQQPEYQRTYGAPLDRDAVPTRGRQESDGNASTSAEGALRALMSRGRRGAGT